MKAIKLFNFEQPDHHFPFFILADFNKTLTNIGGIFRFYLNGDFDGILHVVLCQSLNRLGHGSREKSGLSFSRRVFKNPFYVVDESHAEHFVCFIEYQNASDRVSDSPFQCDP